VVTSKHVAERTRPILLICHYSGSDGWAFLTGEAFSAEEGQLVLLKNIVELDTTVEQVADLPRGWSAKRKTVGGEWIRFEDAELEAGGADAGD
jgi:hypothetical protein